MSLESLGNLAEIVGVLVVIAGFLFGYLQLQQYSIQRRATAAIELARSVQAPPMARALRLVLTLPPGLDGADIRERGSEYEDAAMLVCLTFESVGLMAHRHMVSLELVWEFMGGALLGSWERLEDWTHEIRDQSGDEKFNEWMQWLVEQCYRRYGREEPAYRRHADWLPRGRDRVA